MRAYASVIAGKATSAAAQMIIILILSALVSPNRLAPILAVYALGGVLSSLGDLGLGTLSMRERAYGELEKSNRAVQACDSLAAAVAVIGCTVCGSLSVFYPVLLPTIPLLLWAPLERATETRLLISIADGKAGIAAVITATRRICALALFVSGLNLVGPAWAFSIALALSAALSLAAATQLVRIQKTRPTHPRFLIREALPFAFTALSGQLRNLDVSIVTILVSGVPAAAYGLGTRLASPGLLIFSSVSNVLLPRARRLNPRGIHRLSLSIMILAVLITIALFLLAEPLSEFLSALIPWLTVDAVQIVIIVGSSYIFAGLSIILGTVCVAFGLQKRQAIINIVTIVSSLGLLTLTTLATSTIVWGAIAALFCYLAQSIALVLTLKTGMSEQNVD